jgi:hypothetical protein
LELGQPVDEEMEDEFDPFPGQPHNSLHEVVWQEGVLAALLIPLDPTLPHPCDVRDKHRPEADKSTFYISKEQIFDGIFKIAKSTEAEGVSIATLTEMMRTKINLG